jgi:CBS domain-containing protein
VVERDGRVAGIVTEADLIRRLAGTVEKPRSWLRNLLASSPADAKRYARTHGATARDIMTVDVVSVAEETTAEEIALLIENRGVKRVLVLRDGKLAGVVSRADLLEAVLVPPDTAAMGAEDARIRRAVQAAMQEQSWAKAYFVWATVEGGVVTFHGFCNSEDVTRAFRVLAEGIPGVRGVEIKVDMPSEPLATSR